MIIAAMMAVNDVSGRSERVCRAEAALWHLGSRVTPPLSPLELRPAAADKPGISLA